MKLLITTYGGKYGKCPLVKYYTSDQLVTTDSKHSAMVCFYRSYKNLYINKAV